MKRAMVVIGAGFGDEGKGLMTDFHCRHAPEAMVVRFNGGAQAGHTVVTPSGDRHVFSHFGSGTFAGARTYLSRHFLVNPVLWRDEWECLQGRDLRLRLFVDREAAVTTIYDMLLNQWTEDSRRRAGRPHGSCGVGVHETMLRQRDAKSRMFACDLMDESDMERAIFRARDYVLSELMRRDIDTADRLETLTSEATLVNFFEDCAVMRANISIRDSRMLSGWDNIVFEGAQGLLLDAKSEFFPHVTDSRTGLCNVVQIAEEANIEALDVTYVTRSYMTRHGAGELPGENPKLRYEDLTNNPNEWQGKLRFAPLNTALIDDAIKEDLESNQGPIKLNPRLAITHVDQTDLPKSVRHMFSIPIRYMSSGPTHQHVRLIRD